MSIEPVSPPNPPAVIADFDFFTPAKGAVEYHEATNARANLSNLSGPACPEGVKPVEFKRAVIAAYAAYTISGQVLFEDLRQRSNISAATLRKICATPEFRAACRARGVELDPSMGLDARQDLLLLVLRDTADGLTLAQKLKRAGVSNAEYQAWLKHPVFAQQYAALMRQLQESTDDAMVQLHGKANSGDVNAIKFLFEVTGRYNPNDRQAVNAMAILQAVLESLSRHVRDPEVLAAVAGDLRDLAERYSIPG